MPDLRPLFRGLPSPPPSVAEAPILAATQVAESPRFRVARSARNYPLVLLETVEAPPAMPPLELEHIRIEHARPCRVQEPGGRVHSGVFAIFSCTTGDTVLQDHFLLVAGALIAATPIDPHPASIAEAIETMAELFRALQAPARAPAQGLWAEVFMVAESRQPAELAKAWRVATDDRFDFSSRATRIEVKSTSGPDRTHHFSLEQLRPPSGVRALVASIHVEHAGGGTALEDLLAELRSALAGDPDVLLRVESIVASTLGSTLRVAITERFDREVARASLSYYRVEDVPSLREALPPGVSDVRFRASLAATAPIDPRQLLVDGVDPIIGSLPSPRYRS